MTEDKWEGVDRRRPEYRWARKVTDTILYLDQKIHIIQGELRKVKDIIHEEVNGKKADGNP